MYTSENFATFFRDDLGMLLSDQLGTFRGGDKAIWILPPDSPQRGNGIHLYIDRYTTKLTNAIYQQRLTLVQFDRDESGCALFEEALIKLRRRFPNARETVLPYRKETALTASFLLPVYRTPYGFVVPLFSQ
jgi:hypothetical protein